MHTVLLEWKGPFNPCRSGAAGKAQEPTGSGLYIYTVRVNGCYVPYDIGQSKDLGARLRSDIVQLLGGQWYLYDLDKLTSNTGLEVVSKYDSRTWNRQYLTDFARLSTLAIKTLEAFEIFWAVLQYEPQNGPIADGSDDENRIRRDAESCLQSAVLKSGLSNILTFTRPERTAESYAGIAVHSRFPAGVTILGIPPLATYGPSSSPASPCSPAR